MVNINLSTSNEGQKTNLFIKKIIYLVIIAVILAGIYIGVIAYKTTLDKKTEAAASEQLEIEKTIKSGSNKDVFDFQSRLALASGLISKKNNTTESLDKIQEVIVDGVYLLSYEYVEKDKSLVLVGETNDYGSIARQILNLKKSDYFSKVQITEITSEENKISFSVKIAINQNAK